MEYYLEEKPFNPPTAPYVRVDGVYASLAQAEDAAQRRSRRDGGYIVQVCEVDGCGPKADAIRRCLVRGSLTFNCDD